MPDRQFDYATPPVERGASTFAVRLYIATALTIHALDTGKKSDSDYWSSKEEHHEKPVSDRRRYPACQHTRPCPVERDGHDTNQLIEHYRAYIGEGDLFNSKGTRLMQPWQIIRQDRANFHQYGVRDNDDQSDSFFADPANRQSLEAMLRNGTMTEEAAAMIVHGNVWIDVDIYGSQGTGRWIDVTVSD